MSYKTIDAEVKLEVVKEYWRTGNVSTTAREYGVSRNAVYDWSNLVGSVSIEAFEHTTPGKHRVPLEEQVKILREELQEVLDEYHKIAGSKKKEPVLCSNCKSEDLWRNGRVFSKRYGIRQRFICRRCSLSIYVDLKKTL